MLEVPARLGCFHSIVDWSRLPGPCLAEANPRWQELKINGRAITDVFCFTVTQDDCDICGASGVYLGVSSVGMVALSGVWSSN